MRIHYLQHVPFEGLGTIKGWADSRKHTISATRLFCNDAFPKMEAIDLLIVLGGPMGAYDESIYSWLREEKQFIAETVQRKKKVLGICLGAQLLASSLGAHVYPNTQKEIGWFPVQLTPAGRMSPFFRIFPEQFEAFHWHGDTFDLPDGTDGLVESKACKHQAFSLGRHVLGLQFHLEVEQNNIELLIDNCGNELHNASFIQSAELMLQTTQAHKDIHTYMNSLLDQFAE